MITEVVVVVVVSTLRCIAGEFAVDNWELTSCQPTQRLSDFNLNSSNQYNIIFKYSYVGIQLCIIKLRGIFIFIYNQRTIKIDCSFSNVC